MIEEELDMFGRYIAKKREKEEEEESEEGE